jgi:hypothetical protein
VLAEELEDDGDDEAFDSDEEDLDSVLDDVVVDDDEAGLSASIAFFRDSDG